MLVLAPKWYVDTTACNSHATTFAEFPVLQLLIESYQTANWFLQLQVAAHLLHIYETSHVTMNTGTCVYTEKGNTLHRVPSILISRLILDLWNVFHRMQKNSPNRRGEMRGFYLVLLDIETPSCIRFLEWLGLYGNPWRVSWNRNDKMQIVRLTCLPTCSLIFLSRLIWLHIFSLSL